MGLHRHSRRAISAIATLVHKIGLRLAPWSFAVLVAACSGGSTGTAPQLVPPRAAFAAALPLGTADQILNWAEINFPQHFPKHTSNLTAGEWTYRAYPETGVLLGLREGHVFIVGGIFGPEIQDLGPIANYLSAPIPVAPSSYENKMAAGAALGSTPHPSVSNAHELVTSGVAFGDFFQEGSYSAVVFSNQPDAAAIDSLTGRSFTAGKAYFYKWVDGQWADATSKILADQTGCIAPRKLLVADFNGDGKPDVFASCTGHDDYVDGILPGEHPRFLLSQPDGTYRNVEFVLNCYCHSATAADFGGDGFADIVVHENSGGGLLYYVNQKDGTFRLDTSRIPVSTLQWNGQFNHGIWTVEFIDVYGTGKYDLFAGGVDLIDCNCGWSWASKIYRNSGQNTWTDAAFLELPHLGTLTEVYDVAVASGNVYLLRFDFGIANFWNDDAMAIQKVNLETLESSVIYQHSGPFSDGFTTGNEWFIIKDGWIRNLYAYPDISAPL